MPNINSQVPDYSSLLLAVQDYLNRDDTAVVNNIPLFVNTAEKLIKRDLRMPSTEKVVNFTKADLNDSNFLYLPKDFLEMIELSREGISFTPVVLSRSTYRELYTYRDAFCRQGDRLYINTAFDDDTVFTLVYYVDLPETSPENPTSIIYDLCHDVLLYLSVAEGFKFLNEVEQASYFTSQGVERLQQINNYSKEAEFSGGGLRLSY